MVPTIYTSIPTVRAGGRKDFIEDELGPEQGSNPGPCAW